jgi:hypothetical protein
VVFTRRGPVGDVRGFTGARGRDKSGLTNHHPQKGCSVQGRIGGAESLLLCGVWYVGEGIASFFSALNLCLCLIPQHTCFCQARPWRVDSLAPENDLQPVLDLGHKACRRLRGRDTGEEQRGGDRIDGEQHGDSPVGIVRADSGGEMQRPGNGTGEVRGGRT